MPHQQLSSKWYRSNIDKQQAALFYELGDQHEYDFAEGTVLDELVPELRNVADSSDEFFSYMRPDDAMSGVTALGYLDAYILREGPFDGVLAFSQGAVLAGTYIMSKLKPPSELCRADPPFRFAIFISANGIYDIDLLQKGVIQLLDADVGSEVIDIPTAHIWGKEDTSCHAAVVSSMCQSTKREVYIHDGGHEIPGVRMPAAVKHSVRAIRRVISRIDWAMKAERGAEGVDGKLD